MEELQDRYGFSGFPTSVLVDGNGVIREVDSMFGSGALRGERLLPTLERALTPNPSL